VDGIRSSIAAQESQAPRKQFFFEKKNQKTFVRFGAYQPTGQKFFVSFFKKRNTSFPVHGSPVKCLP
jgi:hypothetical protein